MGADDKKVIVHKSIGLFWGDTPDFIRILFSLTGKPKER
jgi:hypothetical protein